jgi:type I restriction enzyme M protein
MVGIESAIAQRNEHQFLRPHDIVLIIKGSVGKVGIVPEDVPAPGAEGWIVGQSGVILRVNDPNIIDPRTLAVYLRSKLGKELLDGVAVRGATIPLIQLRELQRLPIIIPTTEKAAEIGALLDDEDRIQREIEQLRVRQAGLASQVWAMN